MSQLTCNEVTEGQWNVALLIHNFGARWGWMVNNKTMPPYSREWQPVPIIEEDCLASNSKPFEKIKKTSPHQGSNPQPFQALESSSSDYGTSEANLLKLMRVFMKSLSRLCVV